MNRNLPKPPPPKSAMLASSAGTDDARPSPEAASGPGPWPLRITWPAGASIAVIGDAWQLLPDGRIAAAYSDPAELQLVLSITRDLREWEAEPRPGPEQAAMFKPARPAYYEER